MRIAPVFIAVLLVAVFLATPLPLLAQASTADAPADAELYEKALKILTVLLVAAILIENALAVIFNWRVFLTYFSLRGVKTIIAVAVSAVVVWVFQLDGMGDLISAYTGKDATSGLPSKALTALILAGGSGGVNNLMKALGYRKDRTEALVTTKAPENKAWIAIRVSNAAEVGPVHVYVTEVAAPQTDPSAIAGTVGMQLPSLKQILMRNSDRFPQNGGHEVDPGKVYKIEVKAQDPSKTLLNDPFTGKEFRFANRAIVDFEVAFSA